jgi:hypothetical protein
MSLFIQSQIVAVDVDNAVGLIEFDALHATQLSFDGA